MSRNDCSLIAEPISTLNLHSQTKNYHYNNTTNADGHDQVMENLQKLFDAHKRKEFDQQQPGCSTSASNSINIFGLLDSGNNLSNTQKTNIPLLLPSDARSAVLKSTVVAGQLLNCFVIGGECRLVFPQLRSLCFGNITTHNLDETMNLLAIINPHASEEQLNVLKKNHVIPAYLPKCELITKTNAERLIAMLKFIGSPRPAELYDNDHSRIPSLKVAHDCFGGCSALLYPSMMPDPCLECNSCHLMFKPDDFCRHTHQPATRKDTCFWGFDAQNWPYYIRIDDELIERNGQMQNMYEEAEIQLANFVRNYLARQ